MQTKTINLYSYDELSKEAQENVLKYFRETNDYPSLSMDMEYHLAELLKENKIKETGKTKISYSLSYCQGDGAMFEGTFEWNGYNVTVKHSGHYYHFNSKDIDITDEEGNQPETDEVENAFNEIYVKICKDLEKYGYDVMRTEDSEENITEMIQANDYLFTSDGKLESL